MQLRIKNTTDFGDCYTGIASSKVILMRNMTEVALHVELTSDRPKEVTFELKLQQNRSRVSRAPRADDLLSPTNSNDGLSLKGSLSPDGAKAPLSFSNMDAYGLDSDEEVDDNEEEFQQTKGSSFEENPMGDADDLDDDFEFDREPRALPQSPLGSPKMRGSRGSADLRKKTFRTKGKKSSKVPSRVRDLAYDSGVDSNLEGLYGENSDSVDLKAARLTKQTFRVSFRCFLMQGAWQQAQSRVYDRTLGKSIHIRARTCTSMVTVTPSILHLGDCNIGELKSSSCMLTNHSELPTVVKPLVTSKVISTVPNDDMMLGPKQSTELKIEIIPRKTNPNYSRLISIINMKNKSNIPQICVRSSNMDAHHVIYHSLFYKLLTQSRSAFLNFEHVTFNSVGIQVFDLENITNAPLHLNIQSSAPSKVRLYCIKHPFGDATNPAKMVESEGTNEDENESRLSFVSTNSQNSVGGGTPINSSTQISQQSVGRTIRRRRSFCSVSELAEGKTNLKRGKSTALRELLTKKLSALTAAQTGHPSATGPGVTSISRSVSGQQFDSDKGRLEHNTIVSESKGNLLQAGAGERKSPDGSSTVPLSIPTASYADGSSFEEVTSLLQLFAKSRADCDAYCHSSLPSKEKEEEIVAMVRERTKRLQTLLAEKKLVLLSSNKERNLRIPAKSRQRIVAVFSPVASETATTKDVAKTRVEKHKIMITLPPGGNKKAVTDGGKFDQNKPLWASSKHPFDTRPSVRELLLKSRVCRSVMNVNQKNINFGRISTSSKSSKRLIVQNMSATPLVYSVEKTGSISSGFLQIKEGEVGVVKAFGTKEICFQFQPTLAGPFEEKLKIINVQDTENSVSVTIKARVVKRETFKLLQSGQTISFGKCLVGEKTDEVKIAVRNTSRKKREYVIQLDPSFTAPNLRPTFYFSVDETPATVITQAQEKKLDEELEKLEHKLRIAITKKKADKIVKLNAKISQVKALLSGEQLPKEPGTPADSDVEAAGMSGGSSEVGEFDPYDSANSESELSESESATRSRRRRSRQSDKPIVDVKTGLVSSSTNSLHFSLGAEATGRIVACAIFNPIRSGDSSQKAGEDGDKSGGFQSQKMKKRQFRRDATPMVGVGKFLLFEQQNKDVVKELQYNAEIFLRTPAGESAFCRAVGRKPPSVLPPHPSSSTAASTGSENASESRVRTLPQLDSSGGSISRYDDVLPSLIPPVEAESAVVERRRSLTIKIPDSSNAVRKLNVDVAPDQLGLSPTSSSLLVPAEESPADTRGWSMTLSLGSPSYKGAAVVEILWNPASAFRNVLALSCEIVPHDFLIQDQAKTNVAGSETSALRVMLPLKLNLPPDRTVSLNLKWCYTSDAGFASSTPLSSCVSRSILESVSEAAELNAGKVDFFYHPTNSSPQEVTQDLASRSPVSTVNVAVVKAVQRSLCFEMDSLDLGEHQQGDEVRGEAIIHNRSHQPLQFLLLAGSRDQVNASTSSAATPLVVGGDITFENATGTVEAGAFLKAAFVYRGSIPGQHNEQIVLRNLSGDRLDTSVLTLSVRVTRPVYVRIPELDPQATGQLEVLDLGPCYVTPEMQDTSADSPNVSLRFSKVHKLTLQSQVDHTLVICASSNLKTQCYVYEDARLHREATHVVMKGMQSIDLYVAIRPRLSSDAIKTGSTRDLVGGIRVQLFGLLATADILEEGKSDMLAEFTVKFVGVAGASIARVTPSLIDFGVEYNSGRMQTCQTHEGRFELINMSKALPLGYRLFVTSTAEGYSDDDDSLHISLKHEKGEIPPGETGSIDFRMMAYTNGLFRRRIMVENIHYPGKVSFVDVVLFVDSGALHCDVFGSTVTDYPGIKQGPSASDSVPIEALKMQTVDFGLINVIRLEDELTDNESSGAENEPIHRKYRIYGGHGNSACFEDQATVDKPTIGSDGQAGEKTLVLTNTTDRSMLVRPLSTLPLTFKWKHEDHSGDTSINELELETDALMAQLTSMSDARRLRMPSVNIAPRSLESGVFYGKPYSLEANATCSLSFRFASIAATVPLPVDTIENGKLCPLRGMIGIQGFDSDGRVDSEEACTLKVVNVLGCYGEPRFHIPEKRIALGKIGYAIGWKSSIFEVSVKNISDVVVSFVIANMPACIHVRSVRDASRITFHDNVDRESGNHVPSLRMLALHADKPLVDNETAWSAWKLQPRTSCFLAAGTHEFPLRFLNLSNPHNHEDVLVRAQIISSYAELAVDPESSDYGMETAEPKESHVAFLPPVTVPTPQDAPPHRASFWFSLRNVYDEELCVKLSSQTHSSFDRTLELLLMLRSANTPLSSIVIAPGESVDIRVVCHVLPSARLPADTWSTGSSGATSEILDLGRVWLDINLQNAENASQLEEVHVKGKLLPGKTFLLSASNLHFFATATEMLLDIQADQLPPSLKSKIGGGRDSPQLTLPGASHEANTVVVHQLRNSFESFWVRNPSTVEVLNFVINPVSMHQPGLCLIEGSTESDMCAISEWIQAVAVPSSGTIAPGESVKITVHLEEAASASPSSMTSFREGSDSSPSGKLAALHKMRHHPSWRSNSWDADGPAPSVDESGQSHMFLTVRDADSNLDTGVSTDVDVLLVLQQQSSVGDNSKQGGVVLDKALISAAFESRNRRLAQSRKLYPGPALETHLEDELYEQSESSGLDNFEEFDISSIRSGAGRKNHLPVLTIRGCTPAEYSSLENTRYLIDVGQHTVRNGGEVEWEITIESLYSAASAADPSLDSVEYRIMLVDKNARSWLQLSRERGTLDRAHSYQSVVLYFLRGVVGVYSTFMVLQNLANPSDMKVIHVRLEVIADLNSLRGMSSGLDPATNLFRVLVSNHGNPKRSRRSSIEMPSEITSGGAQRLMIDFSEVYYYKLYQNHSIVIENSSGLSLDFILSTNARPQEVSFSVSPMSFNEVTTVTLGAHASMQVFLHFRPQPKQLVLPSTGVSDVVSDIEVNDPWVREIEVYVSCRLVKDFRETVILRAICSQPQLMVSVANGETNESPLQRETYFSAQPTFLGLVFPMLESTLSNPELSVKASDETQKFLVVRNTKSDSNARLALRNDSMFFSLAIDESLTQPGVAKVDLLDHGVCAGRRSTLLVTIQPQSVAVFRVKPDVAALWKHHQLWDHSVKEHVTLYNIKQFAEHYQVTLCFTCRCATKRRFAIFDAYPDLICVDFCSNVASFYIPPNISESYPISALEDIVAKFLQKSLVPQVASKHSSVPPKLAEILNDLESALDLASPLSPRNLTHAAMQTFEEAEAVQVSPSRDDLYQLVQSYRALYFDFYYITDELVWYGVRGNAVRHSLALADLAYGVVFNHEVFRSFMGDARTGSDPGDFVAFPRLLLPWIRQLGHFLSFFPENQEATQPLRQVYEQLRKFEAI
ncbi:unnamed protein product [Phytophthora lilii]|uniref:Unnamed protein product n=1 Tax=Phytophthora lilii TaxID=2077276 RepID=A0A9W6TN50_9STRA|nr:unnamed protein product [Phytophthora lilii]